MKITCGNMDQLLGVPEIEDGKNLVILKIWITEQMKKRLVATTIESCWSSAGKEKLHFVHLVPSIMLDGWRKRCMFKNVYVQRTDRADWERKNRIGGHMCISNPFLFSLLVSVHKSYWGTFSRHSIPPECLFNQRKGRSTVHWNNTKIYKSFVVSFRGEHWVRVFW